MIRFRKHEKIYREIDQIPRATAGNTLTQGCLYWLGYRDMNNRIRELNAYLQR